MSKRILVTFLCVFILGSIVGAAFFFLYGEKITQDNLHYGAVYNTSLGHGVAIGMSKSDVDKMFGSPTVQEYSIFEYFSYDRGNLILSYKDGLVDSISISGISWVSKYNRIGSYKDSTLDFFNYYPGEYDYEDDSYSFYADKNNIVSERSKAMYSVKVWFEDDKIKHLIILRIN